MNAVALALLLALAAPPQRGASATGIGAPRGPPLSGAALDARTQEIGELLRCPVCQGLSVADSPSTMARNMKAQVREKLAAGYEQEQILSDFESSYGEFVRLQPTMRGVNWLVWFGPLAVLLGGGGIVAWALKRSRRDAGPGDATQTDPAARAHSDPPSRGALPDDPRLAAAVRRVRQLAYGWPDGVPPRAS